MFPMLQYVAFYSFEQQWALDLWTVLDLQCTDREMFTKNSSHFILKTEAKKQCKFSIKIKFFFVSNGSDFY